MRPKLCCLILPLFFVLFISSSVLTFGIDIPQDSKDCIECHTKEKVARATIDEWMQSRHSLNSVGCYDCHRAVATDPDAVSHYGKYISVIVSPKDCGGCHQREAAEFGNSHHAKGADILGSLDNLLGESIEGIAAVNSGCKQCHGSEVKVLEGGRLDPATWPNTGIGRINPDGSRGSCSACHSRHSFSVEIARRPDNCGKCHLGPDHPQKEIYDESKHGIAFYANEDRMNLKAQPWVLTKDYSAAPTCATCHMSATPDLPVSHDIGMRISWTLRPEVSKKLDNWEVRRGNMKKVCGECHSPKYVDGFYTQFDEVVNLYNNKFAVPAKSIMEKLRESKKLTPTQFDEKLEWTYYLLWHHEGRRARHGAAMMGPDYTQWHGFFEVAERFYTEFIPEAEALLPGVTKDVMNMDVNAWKKGVSKEERDKIKKYYQDRYGQ